MQQVKVGVVGVGGAGWVHLAGYLEAPETVAVTALCDIDAEAMDPLARRTGARKYSSYEEMVKDPEIDAVDICLPHYLHERVALAAIEAGKHVLVEKPLTVTVEEADRVIAAARRKGVKLMVAHNARFADAYIEADAWVKSGALGEISHARAYVGGNDIEGYNNPAVWRSKYEEAGGGAILDSGVHSFDVFEWMVGRVKSVFGATNRFIGDRSSQAEDNAAGFVRFESGALASWSVTYSAEIPWTERLELYGTKGSVIVDMLSERPVEIYTKEEGGSGGGGAGRTARPEHYWKQPLLNHSITGWKFASMKKEVKHFALCVSSDVPPVVSGAEGRRAVEIAQKAYDSVRTGREVSTAER